MRKQIFVAWGLALASFGASAQMPAPLLNQRVVTAPPAHAPVSGARMAAAGGSQEEVIKQLEDLLLCKSGPGFSAKSVEPLFRSVGLVKHEKDGYFRPPRNGPRLLLFDDEVVAAQILDDDYHLEASVYLANHSQKQMAKTLGIKNLEGQFEPESDVPAPPAYVKNIGRKIQLLVRTYDDQKFKFKSNVACLVKK